MFLVHQSEKGAGKWQVAWMWLPHFLALDHELHKFVDGGMTEAFGGKPVPDEEPYRSVFLVDMSEKVISLILQKYSMPGLKEYLNGIRVLDPEGEVRDELQRENTSG